MYIRRRLGLLVRTPSINGKNRLTAQLTLNLLFLLKYHFYSPKSLNVAQECLRKYIMHFLFQANFLFTIYIFRALFILLYTALKAQNACLFVFKCFMPQSTISLMSARCHRFLDITSTFRGVNASLLKDTTRRG